MTDTFTCFVTYMWNLEYDISERIYETETHRHGEQTCGCQREGAWGREGLGVWDEQMQTNMYRMDKQDPTVQHGELCSMPCDKL